MQAFRIQRQFNTSGYFIWGRHGQELDFIFPKWGRGAAVTLFQQPTSKGNLQRAKP